MRKNEKPNVLALTLLICAGSLQACATASQQPQQPPTCLPAALPAAPVPPADLMTPPPSDSFSARAAADMRTWQKLLTHSASN